MFYVSIGFVSASQPDFQVTQSIKNNSISGYDVDYANLVFIRKPYIPDNYTLTNFTNFNTQQYDLITWVNDKTIVIKSPDGVETILTNKTKFLLNKIGVYQARQLSNSSKQFLISVFPAEENRIILQAITDNSGIMVNFSKNNFTLNNDEVIVKEHINISDDLLPGTYQIIVKVNNKTLNQELKVLKNYNFTITNKLNTTTTIKSGETEYLGSLVINNNGNVDYKVEASVKGNDSYIISVPKPLIVFRKSFVRIDVQAQIPTNFKTGNHTYELIINNSKYSYKIPLIISVVDNVKPSIQQINFSSDLAFTQNKITLLATDNIGVVNATMKIFNKTLTMKRDKQLFTITTIFNKLSRYNLEFCVYDSNNNKDCKSINKTFKKLKLVKIYNQTLVFPTKKVGFFAQKQLFSINKTINDSIIIKLQDFKPLSVGVKNGTYSARLIDSKGIIYKFDEYNNNVVIKNTGIVSLAVRSEVIGDFEGTIRIIVPDYVEQPSDINFQASFKDYDIPEPFSIKWIGNNTLTCKVKDTGDLSTSYYDCNLHYPINIKPDEIAVPTTVNERKMLMNEANNVKKEFDDYKHKSSVYISLLIVVIIIGGLISYFLVAYYPFINYAFGGRKENK